MTKKSTNKTVIRYTSDANAMFFKHAARYAEVSRILIKALSKTGQPGVDEILKEKE